jgi:hypothetical protein
MCVFFSLLQVGQGHTWLVLRATSTGGQAEKILAATIGPTSSVPRRAVCLLHNEPPLLMPLPLIAFLIPRPRILSRRASRNIGRYQSLRANCATRRFILACFGPVFTAPTHTGLSFVLFWHRFND